MKIALLGYGKMGRAIEEDALANGHEIVLKINDENVQELSPENLKKADVAIEFSTPASVLENIYHCLDAGVPVVVGTTGWYDKLPLVESDVECRGAALFYASNYSVGVNIFFQMNEMLAETMNDFPEYRVEMEEVHHLQKLDSPSGTAITLAEGMGRFLQRKKGWENRLRERAQLLVPAPETHPDREGEPAEDSPLLIHSIREGDVKGIHTVSYRSDVDQITISHEAFSRRGFAQGAVLAAEWLVGKTGVYNMRDLLGFVHEPRR